MAIRTETELYEPVKQYLHHLGYIVRAEVNGCDIVAVRDGDEQPVIVELKKTFNLPLLIQGMKRLNVSDTVYVAVEHNRKSRGPHQLRWSDLAMCCRKLGLGLITVKFFKTKKPEVEVLCDPTPYQSKPVAKRKTKLLTEFHERSGDYNVGGSTRRKLVTAYRERALHAAHLLRENGPMSPKSLRELTEFAKVQQMLRRNVYGWFRRVKHGVYELTPSGEQALETYAAIVQTIAAKE